MHLSCIRVCSWPCVPLGVDKMERFYPPLLYTSLWFHRNHQHCKSNCRRHKVLLHQSKVAGSPHHSDKKPRRCHSNSIQHSVGWECTYLKSILNFIHIRKVLYRLPSLWSSYGLAPKAQGAAQSPKLSPTNFRSLPLTLVAHQAAPFSDL